MSDLIINLDFIPANLDGEPLMSDPLAKVVGKLLCESRNDTEYCLERYKMGKELYDTGKATFMDKDSPATQAMIAYLKLITNKYAGFSNEIKGQILEKFI
jgi:hypothetical protein